MTDIGFDVLGDLYLKPHDSFNWEGKATSLYCLLTGNISNDVRTLVQTLSHLARFYQGVFFVPGTLEFSDLDISPGERTAQLQSIAMQIPNVCMLYHHVAIIDGVGIIGVNGWNGAGDIDTISNMTYTAARFEDISYLNKSISKLQKHLDVKKIIVVSNAIPNEKLYFGNIPEIVSKQVRLDITLDSDTESKVSSWVFGSIDKFVETTIDNINYISNPYTFQNPYWAKRITISV